MNEDFNPNTPIYVQLVNRIKKQIVSGFLKPGEKLLSVRDLASFYGVNPNTMQRALAELEREELMYTERTLGRYITTDAALISEARTALAEEQIQAFLKQMQEIGFTGDALSSLILKRIAPVV